ncbi:MAG: tRNA-dihydrouridine synthase family protein [Kiritimatiellae bacterium]|nr:tRNA-dihydrouridine synthase family protein [Kiritimatiellia bacterium]
MILAPLRGVTTRCFRRAFAEAVREAGFREAVAPFVSAMPGVDPLADRELRGGPGAEPPGLLVTPQFIGKDPAALRHCLDRVRGAGYETADLNCGCPFPMVRNKGRGSGLLRSPDVLRRMLEAGCEAMGPGRFSVKARLGVERADELLELVPLLNEFPLRFLAVHARTARQMYGGEVDGAALDAVAAAAKVPVVRNGDLDWRGGSGMVGRSFVRHLGEREDACGLLRRYVAASMDELRCERPVLGRVKELVSYWRGLPRWRRRWDAVKLCRKVDELLTII